MAIQWLALVSPKTNICFGGRSRHPRLFSTTASSSSLHADQRKHDVWIPRLAVSALVFRMAEHNAVSSSSSSPATKRSVLQLHCNAEGSPYILLIKRAKEPYKGFWTLPGGVVNFGETIEAAAKREVKEECGVDVVVGKAFAASNIIQYDEPNSLAGASSSSAPAADSLSSSSSPRSTVFSSGAVSTTVVSRNPSHQEASADATASSPLAPSSSSSSSSSSAPSAKYHFGIVHVLAIAAHHAHLQASLPSSSSSSTISSITTSPTIATDSESLKPADDAADVQWVAVDHLLGTSSDRGRNSFGAIMISPLTPGLLEVVEMGQAILRHAPHLWAAQSQRTPPAR